MLFKTRDPFLECGYFYYELPRKFRFEVTQKDGWFDKEESIFLGNTGDSFPTHPSRISQNEFQEGAEINELTHSHQFVQKGTKHVLFQDNGIDNNIFFYENAYIIDKKNQTVETL
jgi:hypothetical protein